MSKKRGRGLSKEDHAVWDSVRRSVTPLPRETHSTVRQLAAPTKPKPENFKEEAPPEDLPPFRIGERKDQNSTRYFEPRDMVANAPLRMDRKTYLRMKRGKTPPEARIDLHGMTLAEAHPALIRFIADSHNRGLRTVLVITGKGRSGADDGPIPERRGVLKHQVPQWLNSGPLRSIVQQVLEAHQRHGGGGAFYVHLRRKR